jgi:hypothetical protein
MLSVICHPQVDSANDHPIGATAAPRQCVVNCSSSVGRLPGLGKETAVEYNTAPLERTASTSSELNIAERTIWRPSRVVDLVSRSRQTFRDAPFPVRRSHWRAFLARVNDEQAVITVDQAGAPVWSRSVVRADP